MFVYRFGNKNNHSTFPLPSFSRNHHIKFEIFMYFIKNLHYPLLCLGNESRWRNVIDAPKWHLSTTAMTDAVWFSKTHIQPDPWRCMHKVLWWNFVPIAAPGICCLNMYIYIYMQYMQLVVVDTSVCMELSTTTNCITTTTTNCHYTVFHGLNPIFRCLYYTIFICSKNKNTWKLSAVRSKFQTWIPNTEYLKFDVLRSVQSSLLQL